MALIERLMHEAPRFQKPAGLENRTCDPIVTRSSLASLRKQENELHNRLRDSWAI